MKYIIPLFLFFSFGIVAQESLSFNLELNKEYHIYYRSEFIVNTVFSGSKMMSYSETTGHSIYKVVDQADTINTFEVTLGDYKIIKSSPDSKVYYDSSDPNRQNDLELYRLFNAMKGLQFNLVLSNTGYIIANNYRETVTALIANLIKDNVLPGDETTIDEYRSKLGSYSPSYSLWRITSYIPKNEVEIGETWLRNDKRDVGMPFIIDDKSKLVSKKNGKYSLESKISMKTFERPEDKRLNKNIIYQLVGEASTNIELSKKSRWFNKITRKAEIKGSMLFITEDSDTLRAPTEQIIKDEFYSYRDRI